MAVCGPGTKRVGPESQGSCTCAFPCSCTKLELVMFFALAGAEFAQVQVWKAGTPHEVPSLQQDVCDLPAPAQRVAPVPERSSAMLMFSVLAD